MSDLNVRRAIIVGITLALMHEAWLYVANSASIPGWVQGIMKILLESIAIMAFVALTLPMSCTADSSWKRRTAITSGFALVIGFGLAVAFSLVTFPYAFFHDSDVRERLPALLVLGVGGAALGGLASVGIGWLGRRARMFTEHRPSPPPVRSTK